MLMMKAYQRERKRPPGDPDAPHAGAGYEGIKEETLTTTYLSYNHDDYKLNSQKIALYRWCVQKGRLSDGREILRQLVNRTARIQL